MNVGIAAQIAVCALDDGNRAVLAAWNAPFRQALAVVGRQRVDEDAEGTPLMAQAPKAMTILGLGTAA
jgi:hypothetical protein